MWVSVLIFRFLAAAIVVPVNVYSHREIGGTLIVQALAQGYVP